MKLGFRILAALAVAFALLLPASAASLLPNGKQQVMDANGAPCVGCKLYFYIPTTTTPKDTYQDSDQTILNTNPVVLDSLGTAIIYGTGVYRQILKDATNVTLWDAITADQVSLNASWAGISSGSANAQTVTLGNFSLEDGQLVYFLAGISNTSAATLNVSGTGNVSIVSDTSTGPQALGGGEIIVGNVIGVVYDAISGVFHIVTPTPIQSFNGAVYFNGIITPTILAADTNDWAPTGGFTSANTIRVSSSSNIKITGLAGGASGRTIIVRNIGAFIITLTANSSLSTAGNRFIISAPIPLRPNDTVLLQYDALSGGWAQLFQNTALPVVGGFRTLVVTNGATPNNQIIATADAVTLENAAGNGIRRLSISCTADVTVSGAGGLDTGSVTTSTWYSYWIIYNPATNADSCLLSTSQTFSGLTLPSGYTFAGRFSWNRTDGSSHFMRVRQQGRAANYVITAASNTLFPPIVKTGVTGTYSTTSPTLASVSIANFVPPTANKIAINAYGSWENGTSSNILVAPNTSWGGTNNGPNGSNGMTYPISGGYITVSTSTIIGLEALTLGIAIDAVGGTVAVTGWEDNL